MKTEDLITDIDKKITHFLGDALQASFEKDFGAVESSVNAAKELVGSRCALIDINGVRFGVTKPELGRKPILVYEGRECFANKCIHAVRFPLQVKCGFLQGPELCDPTPEYCPRLKP